GGSELGAAAPADALLAPQPVVALVVEVGLPPQHVAVGEGHRQVAVVVRGVAALGAGGVLDGVGDGAVAVVHHGGLAGEGGGQAAGAAGQVVGVGVDGAGVIEV